MKPNMTYLSLQAPGKIKMQFLKIVVIILLLFVAASSRAQINPQFSPNHNVEVCGATEVYFVCQIPKVPDYIKWDFGDGTTAVNINPSHKYTQPGKYTVKMYVEKGGVRDSIIKEDFVYIKQSPVAKFTMDLALMFITERTFMDKSICNTDSMIRYEWNTGDTTICRDKNFHATFPGPGKYTVSLTVMNDLSCTDDYRMDVYISPMETDSPLNTSVTETTETALFELYPNPANENVFVHLKNSVNDEVEVRITDLCGKEYCYSHTHVDGNQVRLDVQNLQSGLYIVTVKVKNEESRMKLYRS